MSSAVTSLDFPKCERIIREMQERISSIHKQTSIYVAAFEEAMGKSSAQAWMQTIKTSGEECMKQCIEVSEGLDDTIAGLRKFDESMAEFADTDINGDF